MTSPAVDTLFLRDIRRGGKPRQAQMVANHLAAFIADATSSLDVAIYDFPAHEGQAGKHRGHRVTDAAACSVTVRIAYDAGKPTKTTTRTFALLAADPAPPGTAQWVADHFGNSDVQIKAITAPSGQLMHSKYVIRDTGTKGGAAVWTGSTNWTDDA